MPEMPDDIREEVRKFGADEGLPQSGQDDLVRLFDTFGRGAGIEIHELAAMLDIDPKTYVAFLGMVGTSLESGFNTDPDPISLNHLIKAAFSTGVALGLLLEGGLNHG